MELFVALDILTVIFVFSRDRIRLKIGTELFYFLLSCYLPLRQSIHALRSKSKITLAGRD